MKKSRLYAIILLCSSIVAILALAFWNFYQLRSAAFRAHERWAQKVGDLIVAERQSMSDWVNDLSATEPASLQDELFSHPGFVCAYWFENRTNEFARWVRPAYRDVFGKIDPRVVLAELNASRSQTFQFGPVLEAQGSFYVTAARPIDRRHTLIVITEAQEVGKILRDEAQLFHLHAFVYDVDQHPLYISGDFRGFIPALTQTLYRARHGEKSGLARLEQNQAWKWLASFHTIPALNWVVILAEPVAWVYLPYGFLILSILCMIWLSSFPLESSAMLQRAREAKELRTFAFRVDNYIHGKDNVLNEPPYQFNELLPIVRAVRWLVPQYKKAEAYPKEFGLERKLLSLLLETLPEGILFFNAQGTLQLGNELGKVFLALQQESGREYKLVSGVQIPRGFLEPYAEPIFTGQQPNIGKEVEVSWADGKHLYRVWVESVEVDDKIEGFIVIVRDITFRKQWEYVQEQVLSGITHDLRGPLSAIMGYLDLVKRQLKEGPPKVIEYVGLAREAGVRLTQMVSDILDVVRFEQGKIDLEIQAISVDEMFKRLKNIFGVMAGQKNVTLDLRIGNRKMEVSGDPKLLERVLDNLVGNAIKFTPTNGTITVTAERGDGRVLFQVSDTGRGIPKEAQSRIFDKFQQVRPGDRSAGYGLGLAVAKFIVEAHKGEIRVESEVSQGSRFMFWIPDQSVTARAATLPEAFPGGPVH